MVFKLATIDAWTDAIVTGVFEGSSDDRRDGYIHLSSGPQLAQTARKYFANVEDLCLIAFATTDLGADLKWEPSRDGDLFPHYYGPLAASSAIWVRPVPLDADGLPVIHPTIWEVAT